MKVKRVLSMLLVLLLCCCTWSTTLLNVRAADDEEVLVQPRFAYLSMISVALVQSSGNIYTADASATAYKTSYYVSVSAKIQEYTTDWENVEGMSWTGEGNGFASAGGQRYLTAGQYRLRVLVRVYINNVLSETQILYSDIVTVPSP